MSAKGEKITSRVRIKPDTSNGLQELSADLGYFVNTPGQFYGEPSRGDLLDALITAYRTNPTAVTDALRALGIEGEGPPSASG